MNALSRRLFLLSSTQAALLSACTMDDQTARDARNDATNMVDPFIGSGGHGHTYPGVSLSFGMVQISPDTDNTRWDSCSGYHMGDATMLGFSHTHLSGTGVGDMLDVLLRPGLLPSESAEPTLSPGLLTDPSHSYRARYTHADESAEPGYYRVRWPDEGIVSELTATERAGMQRFRFEHDGKPYVLIDFAHGMQDRAGIRTRVDNASLTLEGNMLVGQRQVFQWASGRLINFALEMKPTPTSVTLFNDDVAAPTGSAQVRGKYLKAVFHFAPHTREVIVRTALSGVDIDGARASLAAEIPTWSFDDIRSAARSSWNRALSRITVSGGSNDQRKIFSTALYHTQLGPTLVSDRDGRYRGFDRQIHTLPDNRQAAYSTYSIWDTYRAEHPLLTLVSPERVPDIVQSLIDMSSQSNGSIPLWPLADIDTGCMTGHHAASVIVEAANKGFPGIDFGTAWSIYRRNAFSGTDNGMGEYRTRGWIPCDLVAESTTRTVEYSFDDWALTQLALLHEAKADARTLKRRSHSYRALYDPKTGFIRPKLANGQWAEPFAPNEMGHMARWRDYTESNPWQATFLAQHDVYGMVAMLGGEKAFDAKLDAIFSADPKLPPDAPPDIAGQVGQYAHGNEPSHHIAYLYSFVGKAWKTQDRVRMLQTSMYSAAPDGLAGNEDVGQMSAWFILSALGFYPVDPTTGVYVFGSPLFDRAEIALAGGHSLVIEAPGASQTMRYIQSVQWNGEPWTKSWISHSLLAQGGTLAFVLGDAPNPSFGQAQQDRPPSLQTL